MRPQLYYITARSQFAGDELQQRRRLLAKIAECAAAGVDYIQLREKDLGIRALEELCQQAIAVIAGSPTRLLVNAWTDVALACGAHGVHLPGADLPAGEVRDIVDRAGAAAFVIAASVHSLAEVQSAESHGADFAVFAPVFGKGETENPAGLQELRRICHRSRPAAPPMPVFALGGITLERIGPCLDAGAAGIAGIRLFQENDAVSVVQALLSR